MSDCNVESQVGFVTRDAESPDRVDVPFWITACIRCAPPTTSSGSPLHAADKIETAAKMLLADRIRHANGGVELNRERLARLVGYTSGKKIAWILDFLVEIGFLVIHKNYGPGGKRSADTFDVYSHPPANYAGPRTYAELVKAADGDWPDRDSLFADLSKTTSECESGEPALIAEMSSSRPSASREDVKAVLRKAGWVTKGLKPTSKDLAEMTEYAYMAMSRYGATLEQVAWFAARKVLKEAHTPGYVVRAFRDHGAEVACEPDPNAVLELEDDPELVAAFIRKDATREGTRATTKTEQSGVSVEAAAQQVREWYEKGGPGANAAARLLGVSWPSPRRDDYGSSPEQATAYYAARDQRAREWIKANYDALVAALANRRVA